MAIGGMRRDSHNNYVIPNFSQYILDRVQTSGPSTLAWVRPGNSIGVNYPGQWAEAYAVTEQFTQYQVWRRRRWRRLEAENVRTGYNASFEGKSTSPRWTV